MSLAGCGLFSLGWQLKEFELFSNGAWIESSDARYRPAVRCSGQGKQGGDP
jgi:hypothetical protein